MANKYMIMTLRSLPSTLLFLRVVEVLMKRQLDESVVLKRPESQPILLLHFAVGMRRD